MNKHKSNHQIILDEVNTVIQSLDTMYMYFARTKDMPDDIFQDACSVDFTRLVVMRSKLEKLIEETEVKKNL